MGDECRRSQRRQRRHRDEVHEKPQRVIEKNGQRSDMEDDGAGTKHVRHGSGQRIGGPLAVQPNHRGENRRYEDQVDLGRCEQRIAVRPRKPEAERRPREVPGHQAERRPAVPHDEDE